MIRMWFSAYNQNILFNYKSLKMRRQKLKLLIILVIGLGYTSICAQDYQYYKSTNFTWEGDYFGNKAVWKGGDTHNEYVVDGVRVTVDLLDTFNMNTTPDRKSEFNDFTKTNTFYGRGNLAFQIMSLKSGQNVCLNFAFDKPILLNDFTIFDIDMLQSSKRPFSTFLDSVHVTASNALDNVPLELSFMAELTTLIVNEQQVKAMYQAGLNGDLDHNDPAGAIRINSDSPIEQFKLCLSNGSEDDGMSNSQAIKINKFTFRELIGSIAGRVYDRKNEKPLQGFKVYLVDYKTGLPIYNKDKQLMTAVTDFDGKYQFDKLPMGKYKVIELDDPAYDSDNDIDGINDNTIEVTLNIEKPISIDNDFYETLKSPLPVKLTNMEVVSLKGNQYQIRWQVASELNNEKYIIETSDFGRIYVVSGDISATNNIRQNNYSYNFTHDAVNPTFYVKLSQADFDGTMRELGVQRVNANIIAGNVDVYPNPASDHFVARWSYPGGYAQYEIKNTEGKTVTSGNIADHATQCFIPVFSLAKGLYYVTFSGVTETKSIPIMIQ